MSPERSRLVWLCRRGSRELDLLVRAYLDEAYDKAPLREQECFAGLLERRDEELRGLFFGSEPDCDPTLTVLVEHILAIATPHAHTFANT